jgi:hypothetical protein
MKWTNVIRLYQVLAVYLKLAFGGTRKGRSDYKKFTSNSVLIQCEGSAKAVSTKGKRTKIADFRVFFHNNHLFKVNKSVDS